MALLMIVAIIGITGFQLYWLKDNYDREKQNLEIKTHASFRQTVLELQSFKVKLDRFLILLDSSRVGGKPPLIKETRPRILNRRTFAGKEPPITLWNLVQEKMRDSLRSDSFVKKTFVVSIPGKGPGNGRVDSIHPMKEGVTSMIISTSPEPPNPIKEDQSSVISIGVTKDSIHKKKKFAYRTDTEIVEGIDRGLPPEDAAFRFLYELDSLSTGDSVTVKEISDSFANKLEKDHINIEFRVDRLDSLGASRTQAVTIGFRKPVHFNLVLQNTMAYLLGQLKLSILFSLLLVGITISSFALLYRNMVRQQRLAELKNEFISNITHELKTPIATVGVAIEALKNFNVIDDPKRTSEYLDISQNELQRLNLLVDKVLKLSMFEKKEIELKYELVNLGEIVDEVVASMRLQISKYGARVTVEENGVCRVKGDRLHLISVVFNLLDNALKYGNSNPVVKIGLQEMDDSVLMTFEDNGVGIPMEYRNKIFEKFFRVPHGDTHNAKGYGLGLSYVSHVVQKHKGTIEVESQEGRRTVFTISLPKEPS